MAKRYKEEASRRSSSHQKAKNRSQRKIDKRKVFIFFVIMIVLIAGYFIITNISSSETNSEVRISNSDKKLSSDILILNDLNNEVIRNLEMGNMQLVKAHYKLENLENGKVDLYYKVDDKEIVKVDIEIENKKIEKAEKVENATEMSLSQIENNLGKDIKGYYENNKHRLKPEEGKTILNISVSNTEIIINASQS